MNRHRLHRLRRKDLVICVYKCSPSTLKVKKLLPERRNDGVDFETTPRRGALHSSARRRGRHADERRRGVRCGWSGHDGDTAVYLLEIHSLPPAWHCVDSQENLLVPQPLPETLDGNEPSRMVVDATRSSPDNNVLTTFHHADIRRRSALETFSAASRSSRSFGRSRLSKHHFDGRARQLHRAKSSKCSN